jgi:hypothetical protein
MLKSQIAGLALVGLVAAGCSGMNNQQQRALSGAAIGTGAGAAIGLLTGGSVVTGAVIGAAAGTAGGLLYHEEQKKK